VRVVAGVDVGNATTEVAVVAGGRVLGVDRLPTRGRKGSPESLRGAAALVRRLERQLDRRIDEARIAPLRAVDTTTLTIPHLPPPAGRLRVLAASVGTPGGEGAWVGAPLWLGESGGWQAGAGPAVAAAVAVVPAGMGYRQAARRLTDLLAPGPAGWPDGGPARGPGGDLGGPRIGAVLVAGDEGVLIANRLPAGLPVIDQVDVAAVAGCALVAVEVRRPGRPLTLLADPVALAAAFSLPQDEAADAATVCRSLLDCSNAVVGCAEGAGRPAGGAAAVLAGPAEPWVAVAGERIPLRATLASLAGRPVGEVEALGDGTGQTAVDDLFALDLAAVAETATARQHVLGRAALVASLHRLPGGADHAAALADLLDRPVHRLLTEPAAARLGALTTPGARQDAAVVDLGAGTIDVITPDWEVVAAGAGDLLTASVAETLGISRAAADWVKRGPCLRVDGGQRYEAEDGSRGFLDRPAPASAAGMLAAAGPAGLLPFGREHSPAEWRAIRLRLKQAVFAANLRRALGTLGASFGQVLIVGGPAGDDELLGVLLRSFPADVSLGRASVGGTLDGPPAGHRYAAALGLALAPGLAV
jgi:hypothetical protein